MKTQEEKDILGIMETNQIKKISSSDLIRGTRIVQTDHPEYGTWCLVRENPPGTWEVQKDYPNKGSIAVCLTELLHFWQLV